MVGDFFAVKVETLRLVSSKIRIRSLFCLVVLKYVFMFKSNSLCKSEN